MRRSTTITLTLLAGAGLGLAYCNSDPDTEGVLETQAACMDRLGAAAASECEEVFQSARATHAATAPRFETAAACHDATGSDCAPLATRLGADGGATSLFIPAMAGVMIGRALSDGTRGAAPVYAGNPPPVSACLPGAQGGNGCPTSTSGSGSGGGGGTRRFWYSGSSYAGFSENDGRGGFRHASTSSQGAGLLSRGAMTASTSARSGRSGTGASRSGGLGFSAAAHGGGGS